MGPRATPVAPGLGQGRTQFYPLLLVLALALAFIFLMFTTQHSMFGKEQHSALLDTIRRDNLKANLNSAKESIKLMKQMLARLEANSSRHSVPLMEAASANGQKSMSNSVQRDENSAIDLPGAKAHKILTLSDADVKSIGIDVMMSWYGQADGGGTCAKDFGNELVSRWRAKKTSFCQSFARAGKPLDSSIDCYFVQQTRHHGYGDNLCLMRNVAVNLALFDDESKTLPVIKNYVGTRHFQQPYVHYPKGFVRADCSPSPAYWGKNFFPGWNADWTVDALTSSKDAVECEEWIDHPVLVTQRDTFANFFHDSEDFVNVFLAMAILQWKIGDTQMFLTDLYPKGPFWEMWSKVYGQGYPSYTAWDLKQKFGRSNSTADASKKYNRNVCFKQLAIGIYGPAAPITVASWDTPCMKTALVRAYSDFVIRGLNLQDKTHYAEKQPSKTIVVTYMARRPSKEWPEKKYCDSENSFFLCHLWEKFGSRKLSRTIRNEKEFITGIKDLERMKFDNVDKVIVRDVDYNVLSFEEQIEIDLSTDIMIGPHGAGLMHNIFMRDRATLIELFIDGSSANRHFHNLAYWYGRSYNGVNIGNPIDVKHVQNILINTIKNTRVDQY